MIESPYPWKKNHLGKVIHLPFKKNRARPYDIDPLKWFMLMYSPSGGWWWLSNAFVEDQVIKEPHCEFYAVQGFLKSNETEKRVTNWRRSHKKERFLMDILWHAVDDHVLVDDIEAIHDAIHSCLGVEIADLVEETQMREKCGDLLEWISSPSNESSLTRLTPKGFKSIQKLLPPV